MSKRDNISMRIVFAKSSSESRVMKNKALWELIDAQTQLKCHTAKPLSDESSSKQSYATDCDAFSTDLNIKNDDMFEDKIWSEALHFLLQLKLDEAIFMEPSDYSSFIMNLSKSKASEIHGTKADTDKLRQEKDQYEVTFGAENDAIAREIWDDIYLNDKTEINSIQCACTVATQPAPITQ